MKIFVTGFSHFGSMTCNPSEKVVLRLRKTPPQNIDIDSIILPVSFQRALLEVDTWFTQNPHYKPSFLLSMGVHRGDYFRLEQCARSELDACSTDNDGMTAAQVSPSAKGTLHTEMDLKSLIAASEGLTSKSITMSRDAGGYVCESLYHHMLYRAKRLNIDALFLHVPPVNCMPIAEQAVFVRGLLLNIVAQRNNNVSAP